MKKTEKGRRCNFTVTYVVIIVPGVVSIGVLDMVGNPSVGSRDVHSNFTDGMMSPIS